jgi:hypothetical protein
MVDLDPSHDGVAQELRLSDGEVLREWTLGGSPRVSCPEIFKFEGRSHVFFTTATEGSESPESGTLFVAPLI